MEKKNYYIYPVKSKKIMSDSSGTSCVPDMRKGRTIRNFPTEGDFFFARFTESQIDRQRTDEWPYKGTVDETIGDGGSIEKKICAGLDIKYMLLLLL